LLQLAAATTDGARVLGQRLSSADYADER